MHIRRLILFLLASLVHFTLPAQNTMTEQADTLARLLEKNGYENIRVAVDGDTLHVGLENRVWRWEPLGAARVIGLIMPATGPGTILCLTLLQDGIPMTTLVVSRRAYDRFQDGYLPAADFRDSLQVSLSDRKYRSTLSGLKPVNPSYLKADFIIYPQLRVQFGDFVHPLELQFNIAPAFRMTFTRGLAMTAQVIIPVFNNLVNDPEGNTVRPGLVVLSQSFRLPNEIFGVVRAGYFTRNRYGLDGAVEKYFFNGRVCLRGSLGYTGSMQVLEGKFVYSDMDKLSWYAGAAFRIARFDLLMGAGYGTFLAGDRGWRADISRQFGEISVGFFAMRTGSVVNGGFNFTVPLPPRRYGTKNHARIRPAPYVSWEYRAKGLPSAGRGYSASLPEDVLMFNLNPDYIRMQLGKLLKDK